MSKYVRLSMNILSCPHFRAQNFFFFFLIRHLFFCFKHVKFQCFKLGCMSPVITNFNLTESRWWTCKNKKSEQKPFKVHVDINMLSQKHIINFSPISVHFHNVTFIGWAACVPCPFSQWILNCCTRHNVASIRARVEKQTRDLSTWKNWKKKVWYPSI